MPNTIITKRCSKCKQTKPVSEFGKNKSSKDSLHHYCKICHRFSDKRYNQSKKGGKIRKIYRESIAGKNAQKHHRQGRKYKETRQKYLNSIKAKQARRNYKQKNFLKIKAQWPVQYAVRADKIPKANALKCVYCGRQAMLYHHWHGYEPEHWLDIVPTCKICHRKIHL